MTRSEKLAHLGGLLKQANYMAKSAQEIKHKDLDAAQPTTGDEEQKTIEEHTNGNYASDKSVDAKIEGVIEVADKKIEGDDDKKAEKVLAETGTTVDKIHSCETPAGTPAQEVSKSAAFQRKIEAVCQAEMAKEAALKAAKEEMQKQASAEEEVTTATSVLAKVASLKDVKNQEELEALSQDIEVSFQKLAATNPLFNAACEQVALRKMAAEIDALAASEGIAPEEAAAALDAASAEDPEAQAEFNGEVEGEALSDLAGAEQEQAALMDGLDQTAAQVSELVGQEVTSDDIINAVNDVVEKAEELGVPPEALLQAAVEEMTAGEGGEEPSEEDIAQAEALMEEAAKQGISPEEVVEGVTQAMSQEEAAPAEEAAKPAEEMPKEASFHEETLKKLASSKRGANLAKILAEKAEKAGKA